MQYVLMSPHYESNMVAAGSVISELGGDFKRYEGLHDYYVHFNQAFLNSTPLRVQPIDVKPSECEARQTMRTCSWPRIVGGSACHFTIGTGWKGLAGCLYAEFWFQCRLWGNEDSCIDMLCDDFEAYSSFFFCERSFVCCSYVLYVLWS